MYSTFEHDSFFGFLNVFKRFDSRFTLTHGDRPPYPVIIDNPTLGEVIRNLNRADLGLFLSAFFFLGFPLARWATSTHASGEYARRKAFNRLWGMGAMWSALWAVSYTHLTLPTIYSV
eukprot:TRINITY_DN6477_c0_g1_i1.p1 TRINITY_DN6477_c0_g1~~TRINITY_DN6477_c0_g1_i1.p1  ORF type:complete len:118 (+),score=10.35 TRINITY_DN6477_c0_g1_i1:171-524(+)